jgi:hypothetical protein
MVKLVADTIWAMGCVVWVWLWVWWTRGLICPRAPQKAYIQGRQNTRNDVGISGESLRWRHCPRVGLSLVWM